MAGGAAGSEGSCFFKRRLVGGRAGGPGALTGEMEAGG